MSFLQLVLTLDKTKEDLNSILPIMSFWPISQHLPFWSWKSHMGTTVEFVHVEKSFLQSKSWRWNSFVDSGWCPGDLLLLRWGICSGYGIHCTGSRTTWDCLSWDEGRLENRRFLWNPWEFGIQLRVCRIGILFTLPWFDEVAVSPEALSSCWNLDHVGVGLSALIMYHSFFTLPRIRILEPYILSYLEWQCINSTLEILIVLIELAFFLCYQFSLPADPVIHHLWW